MKSFLFFCCCLFFAGSMLATDTIPTMTYFDFVRMVTTNHPVAKQAALFSESAKAGMLVSRGQLDPKLESSAGSKELETTSYYTYWNSTLKVPIWFGTDIKVGYEQNTGINANPIDRTPDAGLWYAGISVPLGQGLFIDERRASIRQAQLMPMMAEADQLKTVNALLLQATQAYWSWYAAYYRWTLLDQACVVAEQRFEGVKNRVIQGDLPSIDTVEAYVAVLDRQNMRTQARYEYEKSILMASVFLWRDDATPLELSTDIRPNIGGAEITPMPIDSMNRMLDQAQKSHPDLAKLAIKQEQLAIDRQLQADKLKPKLQLDYNLLAKSPDAPFDGYDGYYTNNYKFGASFSYPLFLRQERGKLAQVEIKQDQNAFDQQQRLREINNEIYAAYQGRLAYEKQVQLQEKQVAYAQALRDGEQTRFENGESSFFLVNTREMALINSQIKLYELHAKYALSKAELQYYAGQPLVKVTN